MSSFKIISNQSIPCLMLSGVVVASLIGLNSVAMAKDVKAQELTKTQASQNTNNPPQETTHSKWGCGVKRC
ncbi:hypothetical protein C7H19_02640 [Aphanothece hegewaldii CCALA 016]|uniref:Uncharacterized protein n=1 Tax=Aphanothece hegewaldii CCALA 016 TaxID=2107694 RepID=A0A2T1M2J3_9CHRO|nr:hypothetical protein [Aphanothece hegewaldii]PSF38969.1 hypothetical protein C7H19_02640 [Aphanothece hegewaldii CCALA 016]